MQQGPSLKVVFLSFLTQTKRAKQSQAISIGPTPLSYLNDPFTCRSQSCPQAQRASWAGERLQSPRALASGRNSLSRWWSIPKIKNTNNSLQVVPPEECPEGNSVDTLCPKGPCCSKQMKLWYNNGSSPLIKGDGDGWWGWLIGKKCGFVFSRADALNWQIFVISFCKVFFCTGPV